MFASPFLHRSYGRENNPRSIAFRIPEIADAADKISRLLTTKRGVVPCRPFPRCPARKQAYPKPFYQNLMYNTRNRIGRILVKSLALLASQLVLHAGPDKGAGHTAFPAVNLPAVARGHNAVQSLGAHLPDVARAYGIRQEELEALLIQDETLTVDRQGRLHYVEPTFQAGALTTDPTLPQEALAPLADTFKLHSRGGAKRILYLDFDGHLLSGTGWNTSYNGGRDIIAPAWDIDGDPTTFSA